MKFALTALTALVMLTASVLPAFSGGSTWHGSQRRMKKAHSKQLKQEADFWKRFHAEMAQIEKALDIDERKHLRSKKKATTK